MSEDIVLDDLADAWGHSETVDLKAGDVLFREGDDANAMYIVKSGSLRILSGSTVYETVRAGGIVGEMAIIDEDLPRSATVIAGPTPSCSKSTWRNSCGSSSTRRISHSA